MINKLINLSRDKNNNFPKYIHSINFPFFKNLVEGSRIQFDFPLTVFVGANGCGKSSTLQALYGCPDGYSTGDYWFKNSVDSIIDNENGVRNSYWYEYYNIEANKIVQILKLRIKKQGNEDYWEPSRPLKKYGMEPIEPLKDGEVSPGRVKTRYNVLKRNVMYLDFRSELSAFDKYFYFEEHPRIPTYYYRQDYLRYFSKYLKTTFDNKLENYKLRNIEKVHKLYEFKESELNVLSKILGRHYKSAIILEHSFYKNKGTSVLFQTYDKRYSEAYAGSGEMSVAKLVFSVCNAEESSLILLDEPEVSIHPGAQKKIIEFLLNEIYTKNHQVVLSTHSPSIIEDLPRNAIKVFSPTADGKFKILPECTPNVAFQYIGHTILDKLEIVVEDLAAKELVLKVMDNVDKNLKKIIEVNFYPGGADDIYKEMVVFSRVNEVKKYFWLDGDKNQNIEIKINDQIADNELDQLIENFTGIGIKKFQFAGDSNKPEHIIEEKRKYLQFLKKFTLYLPDEPEAIMIKSSSLNDDILNECINNYNDPKEVIEKWVKNDLSTSKAEYIETYRNRLLSKINFNHDDIKSIAKTIKTISEDNIKI